MTKRSPKFMVRAIRRDVTRGGGQGAMVDKGGDKEQDNSGMRYFF